MDDFLSDLYTVFFKEWIKNQKSTSYQTTCEDDCICLENAFARAIIHFDLLNIIEFTVINKVNDTPEFYLHFQMKSLKHAIELYDEMIKCLLSLNAQSKTKVLFVCSGGMTTSYFAHKMNEALNLLEKDIICEATCYSNLYEIGYKYDIVMLAPQISYLHAQAQEILKNQTVIKIPPLIFARYDTAKMIELIENGTYQRIEGQSDKDDPLSLKHHNEHHVLVLSVMKNVERVHIAYRLYVKDDIVLDNEIIKYSINIHDLYDVIDPIIAKYQDIDVIGISIPGIIHEGLLYSSYIEGLIDHHIEKAFTDKYSQSIYIYNDVNAAAFGYYQSQSQYQSISLLFQPVSCFAGLGSVINGKLNVGSHHVAGEVQFLPLDLSEDKKVLSLTPDGTIELVSKMMASIICINNPDLIVLFNSLITNVDKLKDEISNMVPKKYIPKIVKIDQLTEYIFLGVISLCIKGEKENVR